MKLTSDDGLGSVTGEGEGIGGSAWLLVLAENIRKAIAARVSDLKGGIVIGVGPSAADRPQDVGRYD